MSVDAPTPLSPQVTGDGHKSSIADDAFVDGLVRLTGRNCSLEVQTGARLVCEGATTLIDMTGDGSSVTIARASKFTGFIKIEGCHSSVTIGENCDLAGKINVKSDGCMLIIGEGTTANGVSIQMHEPGSISIGDDCMISKEVYISNSDIHPIYDRGSGARLNAARAIDIGHHVWLGLRVMILKGTTVGSGSVVGAGSIAGSEIPANCIASGSPARVVREDIRWERDFQITNPASDLP